MFLLASLVLLVRVPSSGSTSEYDVYHYNDRGYGQSRCTDIPESLRLCYGIGYTQMMLPNLLEHETLAEVKLQASIWVPLVHRRCHTGTQIFLCSLFAPVCMDKPVWPCQQLCESVRDACSPIMAAFGYNWPEMLNCSRFPLDPKEICINVNQTETVETSEDTPECPQCDIEMKTDVVLENLCASEFAIRAKIKKTKTETVNKKVILQKKKQTLWGQPPTKKELKKLVLYLKNGAECPCQQLYNTSNYFLIMGRKVENQYLLTGIQSWNEENEEFRRFLSQIKTYKCPFNSVFK